MSDAATTPGLTASERLKGAVALAAILTTGGWLWLYASPGRPVRDPAPVERDLPASLLDEARQENREKDRLHEHEIPCVKGAS
ncbi:MAG TPA: hypothetical protein VD963_02660 [Phycisphaerales bacterium]|nr:hypothetical protein [Phycisphaerales bacterium]